MRPDGFSNSGESGESDDDIPILQPIPSLRPSWIGQIRTCGNVSILEWSFIALSSISIIVGYAFNVYRMCTLPASSDEYVFAIIILVNLTFCIWYLLHGIFQEQPFEILMFVLTSLLLTVLITLNYATNEDHSKISAIPHLRLIRFIATILLTLPSAVIGLNVGWKYWSSGNLLFKTVGGDMKLQRMCRVFFLGMSLLIFDAQAFVSCLILIIERGVSNLTDENILIISSGILFTILWLGIGYFAIRRENMQLIWLFFATSIIQPVYCIYLIVDGLQEIAESYSTIRTDSIFVAGTALVAAHFSLLASFIIIAGNFGKGLSSAVFGSSESIPVVSSEVRQSNNYGTSATTN